MIQAMLAVAAMSEATSTSASAPSEAAVEELLTIKRQVYPHGDKFAKHAYELLYAQHLAPVRMQKIKFLEIGLGCNMVCTHCSCNGHGHDRSHVPPRAALGPQAR